jgi:hypothetical protein
VAIGRPSYRRGAKKTSDFKIGISNGKPSIQVNWGGRVYGSQLSLIGSGNVKDSLDVSDIKATGNITFGKNSSVYNNSNQILMVGGLTQSGDKNMTIGSDTNLSSMVGHANNINNIAFGDNVMNSTVNGQYNVAIGHDSMLYMGQNASSAASSTAQNVAIGNQSMKGYGGDGEYDTVQGSYNVSIGYKSMELIGAASAGTNADFNTCIGTVAGTYINGEQNTYIGSGAGKGATSGSEGDYNLGIGISALFGIEDGIYNACFGFEALKAVSNGNRNIGIGYKAGNTITTGSDNICIGYDVDVNSSSAENRVIISPTALTVDADNTTLIANTDIILDAAGDITLDADGDQIYLKQGGTTFGQFTTALSQTGLKLFEAAGASTDDWFLIQVGASGATTLSTVDANAAAAHLVLDVDGLITLNADGGQVIFGDGGQISLYIDMDDVAGDAVFKDSNGTDIFRIDTSEDSLRMATNIKLQFGDPGEYIVGDGTNLAITSSGDITLTASGADVNIVSADLNLTSGTGVYFDGGTDTRIYESSADIMTIAVGGDDLLVLEEAGDNGNIVNFGTSSVGFTKIAETFSDDSIIGSSGIHDTHIDFRHSNKISLALTDDIVNMNLIFPAVSGNFLLLLTYDGDHDITNWKVYEADESAADGDADVLWPGGAIPPTTASGVDIFSFFYDAVADKCYGTATLDFSN